MPLRLVRPDPVSNGAAVASPPSTPVSVYQAKCPAQRALAAIASKWAVLILHRLQKGPVRFNALQREIGGISPKVLSQQLRRLENHGLVSRRVRSTVPPSVDYALTESGRDLKTAMTALCEWAQRHAPERDAAAAG
jgi:DNA-binding HxlR family transcriptional regulator